MPVEKTTSPREQHRGLNAQRNYVERELKKGARFTLAAGEAFVRGMRDLGYKSTSTALDEIIDNSLEAEAQNIHIVFGYGPKSDKKPDMLAIIDDGHGMLKEMIRFSVLWGGTHRGEDRGVFGRYGYGLPSASISQARKYTVYSKVSGGELYSVEVDLDDISAGRYNDEFGHIVIAEPAKAKLPAWVESYVKANTKEAIEHGTIVILEKLDRLTWTTTDGLQRNLLEHFGVTYRNFLRVANIVVNGKRVEMVDPLFITPYAKFYDLDEDRAEAAEPMNIEVKDRDGTGAGGVIKVRFSYMPPTFQRVEKNMSRGATMNVRHEIMKAHQGIIVLRNQRQIDVVGRSPWTVFQNYDRNWGVEIDFPPSLDEEFKITTSKQTVVISDRIWEILERAGVYRVIKDFRERLQTDIAELNRKTDLEDVKPNASPQTQQPKRASEEVMKQSEKFKSSSRLANTEAQQRKADERVEQEAKRIQAETGRPVEQVVTEFQAEAKERPYKVVVLEHPGAPFFRIEQFGGQRRLYVNKAHRFFKDVYAGPHSNSQVRSALELLLFVIGDSQLDSTGERQTWYDVEIQEWSKNLNIVLERLGLHASAQDIYSALAEARESDIAERERAEEIAANGKTRKSK